jgi:hypothetical protein
MNRQQVISHLNRSDPNYQAGTLLSPEWSSPERLHVLSLAMQGLEQGIEVETPGHPIGQEKVESEVRLLADANPSEVMASLGKVLSQEDLDDLSAEQGARKILEAIKDLLVAA